MNQNQLSISLDESLKEDVMSCVSEYAEMGLDSILDDGLLKDIPLVGTVISVYKVGRSIAERFYIKKLVKFLEAIKNNTVNETTRNEYRKKITNSGSRDQEIEYLLVILDKYSEREKAAFLAKLYLAYLDDIINWTEFSDLAAILDKILLCDIVSLGNYYNSNRESFFEYMANSSLQRLKGCGLVADASVGLSILKDGRFAYMSEMMENKQVECFFTEYGIKFIQAIITERLP